MYRHFFKRLIDLILSICGMTVLALPMLILALIVKYDSKGPVLFWQKRVGIHKKTFMMPKFRTMYIDTAANVPTNLLNDPSRWITNSGKWLRKLSLDELPQIFCIITGNMSVIGPRPALWNQYDLIVERDKYGANDVLPGLTGWAQINVRDELPISVKAAYDGECVRNMNLAFNYKCFFGIIAYVFKNGENIKSLAIDWCIALKEVWKEKYKAAMEMLLKMKQASVTDDGDKEKRIVLKRNILQITAWLVACKVAFTYERREIVTTTSIKNKHFKQIILTKRGKNMFSQYKLFKYYRYLKLRQYPKFLSLLIGKMYALLPAACESQGIKPCHAWR